MSFNLPKYRWVTSPNFYSSTLRPKLVVLHDTEGSYDGAVSWFSQVQSKVSAHIVLKEDGSEATQMVPFKKVAWHVKAFNGEALGIEFAGIETRGYPQAQWDAGAQLTAYLCKRYGIPPIYAAGGQGSGICQHKDLGAAGGGHHDMSNDVGRWYAFVNEVAELYKNPLPQVAWGRD